MTGDEARAFLLSLPEAREDFPFGPEVAVMKVGDRMFATLGTHDGQWRVNLKCEPQQALMLRDIFEAVHPGYHMNKQHWNTVFLDGSIPRSELERMMEHSYDLVVAKLPARVRRPLQRLRGEDCA